MSRRRVTNEPATPVYIVNQTDDDSDSVIGSVKLYDERTGTDKGLLFNSGSPQICSQPYLYALAEGDIPGHSQWEKIGFTPTMTTAESVIWSKAGAYVYPASGIQMAVVSSNNTADIPGGAGATQVTIEYLDINFVTKWTTVLLSGTTPVNTSVSDIYRINSFRVTQTGANGRPTGNISLTSVGGGTTYSYITALYTRARNSCYCVPAGKTLYIVQATFGYGYSVNQTHYARLWLRANQNQGAKVSGIFYPFAEVTSQSGTVPIIFESPLKFVEKVDIQVGGLATTSGIANCVLRGWLE